MSIYNDLGVYYFVTWSLKQKISNNTVTNDDQPTYAFVLSSHKKINNLE